MGYRYNYTSRLSFQILPHIKVFFVNLPNLPARNLMNIFQSL